MSLTAHRRVKLTRPLLGLVVALVCLSAPASASAVGPYPDLGGCPVFPDPPASLSARAPSLPSEAAWNQDISKAPVARNSAATIAYINGQGGGLLHPDFGSPRPYGFPYAVVGAHQPDLPIHYTAYGDESDPGPFPIPTSAPVEGGAGSDGDRHVLAIDTGSCTLFELYRAFPEQSGGPHWNADSGVDWDLRSGALRPDSWTSADAAGLPIFPGLVRYDEAAAGHVEHAIRVTFESTRNAWVHPASHCAGDTSNPNAPRDGNAAAAAGGLRARPLQRTGEGDRARLQALRDDRRRQRLQLVLQRQQRPPLGRREPRSAEADTRQRLPGRQEQGPPPHLLSAQPAPRTTWWKSARNRDRSSSAAGSAASEPASSTLTSTTSSAA